MLEPSLLFSETQRNIQQQRLSSPPKLDDSYLASEILMNQEITNLEHVLRQNREQLLARLLQQQQQQRQQQQQQPPMLRGSVRNDGLDPLIYSLQNTSAAAQTDTAMGLRYPSSSAPLDLQQMLYQSRIAQLPIASLSGLLPTGFGTSRIANPSLSQPDLLLQSLLSNRQQSSMLNSDRTRQIPDSLTAAQLVDPFIIFGQSLSNSLATLAAMRAHDDKIQKPNESEDTSRRPMQDQFDNIHGIFPPNKKGKGNF